ncbi:hypothetical protein SAMN05660337_0563 [Maridesulfovibrio ferrireducens]|uniref:Lipoprotein n=1 Tax=Maridesulfovibrio ferrireducens TaxID=246191 RepID=A0A1G9C6K6_9BACT|nr:hypothetical protein [Maridesulfovibrio ferrireducens]SDK47303.1 hypothetical protein SAMN05660337_0563 [Maridesulfovibrio ferrireducens]
MTYRIIFLITLLMTLAACAAVPMNGDVTIGDSDLGSAKMSATRNPTLKSHATYSIVSELPDGAVYKGKIQSDLKSVTMFSNDGKSMKCNFKVNDLVKGFESGGTGSCTTSEGQNLNVKF